MMEKPGFVIILHKKPGGNSTERRPGFARGFLVFNVDYGIMKMEITAQNPV